MFPLQSYHRLHVARYVLIDVRFRKPIQAYIECIKISPFVCGNISTLFAPRMYLYISLSISQSKFHSYVKTCRRFPLYFQGYFRCPTLPICHRLHLACSQYKRQVDGIFPYLVMVHFPCTRPYYAADFNIRIYHPIVYFLAFSSNSSMYLSKSDINNLS